ncbi:hypothetical protein PRIC1_012630 [Phytophthora ramorum]|nr:hypothetical protein KRP22_8890 [Phytophthora ramorum]
MASPLDMPEGVVLDFEVEIVAANNIEAGDFLGWTAALRGELSSSDAYVSIEIDGVKVGWTRPIFDTLKPAWNERFYFRNVRPGSLCKLSLFDKDMDADDELGAAQFTVENTGGQELISELPITLADKKAGVLVIRTKGIPANSVDNELLREVGPVRYSVHSSVGAGLLSMLTSNDDRLESLAYRVQLHNIPEFLPTEHEWNKNYPTIQRIFSPDHPESPILRQAILAQHAVVYSHGPENTHYGSISSPADFFKLIHDGRRQDKPVLYTYVITNKGWYFSETGADFFKDMLSKHMLHSGAAFSVLYAGEFRVDNDTPGEPKLIIDNNSGTYAPPMEDLPHVKALLENNFPGIECEALDQHEEALQQARKEILALWE